MVRHTDKVAILRFARRVDPRSGCRQHPSDPALPTCHRRQNTWHEGGSGQGFGESREGPGCRSIEGTQSSVQAYNLDGAISTPDHVQRDRRACRMADDGLRQHVHRIAQLPYILRHRRKRRPAPRAKPGETVTGQIDGNHSVIPRQIRHDVTPGMHRRARAVQKQNDRSVPHHLYVPAMRTTVDEARDVSVRPVCRQGRRHCRTADARAPAPARGRAR